MNDDPPVDRPCEDPSRAWPTAGGDRGRTGRTDHAPPAPDADSVDLLAGVRDGGRRRLASTLPVVADGTAYVPSGGGIVAVDLGSPADDPLWVRDLDDDVDAVPALACGVLLVPGLNRLVALDPATGEQRATWPREEYDLGTVDGLVPVENGFVVRGGSTSGLSLVR